MPAPDGSDIQERQLTIGAKLGEGGEGEVFDLAGGYGGFVYKRYRAHGAANGEALERLVALPGEVTPDERERLIRQTSWPLARVLDGEEVTGFVMRKVPPEFWGTAGDPEHPRPRLRELQYLLFAPKPMWGDIRPPDASGRLQLVRQAAALFHLVHRKHLVIGDVSMSNLLWSASPLALFMVDCDGFRVAGSRTVLPYGETPDWEDPGRPRGGQTPEQSLDSDRYKLALVVGRVLARDPKLRPGDELAPVGDLPERVAAAVPRLFAEAGRPRGLRPDAAQWIRALSDRGEIDLPPLPPVRELPDLPKAPLDDGPRGPRRWKPLPPGDE